MGLQGSDKTNVTSLISALDSAINGLNPADRASAGVKAVLVKTRTQLLEMFKYERAQ
jgi:hypothetical protein